MLFNTWEFGLFFVAVYALYVLVKHEWQNNLLLVAGYVFYGAWDWRFLLLLWLSTLVDYWCALQMARETDRARRRRYLVVCVAVSLTILGVFKYYNFFADNLFALLGTLGLRVPLHHLRVILPVGISFYTFQSMGYAIDVYRRQVEPERRLRDYALFVAFFPQLVAGPIERAARMLPQIRAPRRVTLDGVYAGTHLIFWGLFQKVFVADNLARLVDPVFSAPPPYNGARVLIALYAFAFQLYCDFAGYSNIARGLARCLGFELMANFDCPYVSRSPAEFWRRWHISLSTWLRDYLFLPISYALSRRVDGVRWLGLRDDLWIYAIATTATMLLGGLWHGAAWGFVLWGLYQGLLLVAFRFAGGRRHRHARVPSQWRRVAGAIAMFHLTCLGWLLFRASSLTQAWSMCKALAFGVRLEAGLGGRFLLAILVPFALVEAMQYVRRDVLAVYRSPVALRASVYLVVFYLMVIYGQGAGREFIYFQF